MQILPPPHTLTDGIEEEEERVDGYLMAALAWMLVNTPSMAYEVPKPATPGSPTQWVGYAATQQGRIFVTSQAFWTEEGARREARRECEAKTARTCYADISVPPNFNVAAVKCGGAVFFGASAEGNQVEYAFDKARKFGLKSGCKVILNTSQEKDGE
jgi:hypothetical protein